MSEKTSAAVNADLICRAVKEYYYEKHLGFVLTAVINGRIYKYKYVDLVNVPKHLLTLRSRIKILQYKDLRKKALFTVGTINNFKRSTVTENLRRCLKNSPCLKKMRTPADLSVSSNALKKLKNVWCFAWRQS